MTTITAENNQTLADIAIRRYGSLEALPYLAQANGIRTTAIMSPGTVLTCPDLIFNKEMQDYVQQNNVNPATATGVEADIELRIFKDPFAAEFQ